MVLDHEDNPPCVPPATTRREQLQLEAQRALLEWYGIDATAFKDEHPNGRTPTTILEAASELPLLHPFLDQRELGEP